METSLPSYDVEGPKHDSCVIKYYIFRKVVFTDISEHALTSLASQSADLLGTELKCLNIQYELILVNYSMVQYGSSVTAISSQFLGLLKSPVSFQLSS